MRKNRIWIVAGTMIAVLLPIFFFTKTSAAKDVIDEKYPISIIDTSNTSLETTDLVSDDMKWKYFDGDEDPNTGTWYEDWNKLNGWTYPEGWLDWGVIPMRFSEEDWNVFNGTKFSTSEDTKGQVLAKTDDERAKSTYFFRHTFTLTEEQASSVYAIEITARYNDAITMYINGSPVGGFHNIPTSNYSKNIEYGSQEVVADNEFIEETFIVDDVSSLMNGYIPGEYGEAELKGEEGFELIDAYTDDAGNTFIDITLAVELHANNPDDNEASFELLEFVLNPDESTIAPEDTVKNISLNVGDNENEINFTWNSLSSETGFVEVIEGNNIEKFKDTEATIYEATDTYYAYTKFLTMDYYTNKASINVNPDKDYLYRVGNNEGYSEVYPLTIENIEDGYDAIFLSDAQIGTGTIPTDVYSWNQTLEEAISKYPNTSIILNAGDFVDSPDKENEYDAYFSPELLKSYPTASTVGNHDVAENYGYHFNEPSLSTLGQDEASSNYHFTYGNVLYMVLNTNNMNHEEHIQFIKEVDQQTADEDFDWKVVMFHQSIYASGKQSTSDDVPKNRDALVPIFDEIGVDLVLMGHDHSYARSHHMFDFKPVTNLTYKDDSDDTVIAPDGTLYLTISSASGSKYYDLAEEYDYLAYREQSYVPTFMHIRFDKDSYSISSYRTDTMEVFDKYTIQK